MYEYLIGGMVEAIMAALGVESDLFAERISGKIKAALTEFWANKIAIVWGTEDVIEYAADQMDTVLTEEDARAVLQRVMQDLDAGEGVTWETLEYHANALIHEKRAENEDFADDWLANHNAMEG